MPRIIAGKAGGRRIAAPPGKTTRPTADRVKEALFSSLGPLNGLVVLDLFAGSGGLGIEALSRGAAAASFVENDRRAVSVLRENMAVAGVEDVADVHALDAAKFCADPHGLSRRAKLPFDLVFVDAPYALAHAEIAGLIATLSSTDALAAGARLVLERERDNGDASVPGFSHAKDKRYGDTTLRYYLRD